MPRKPKPRTVTAKKRQSSISAARTAWPFRSLPSGYRRRYALCSRRAYRRLYPEGRLLKRQAVLAALMLLCLVSAVTVLGFGFLGIACFGGLGLLLLLVVYIREPKP